MGQRQAELQVWVEGLQDKLGLGDNWVLMPVAGDASFRRYFRISSLAGNWIAVDAPPEQEDCQLFVDLARVWLKAGIHVPQVLALDVHKGFMLLQDFGDQHYLSVLDDGNVDLLYQQAMTELLNIQMLDAVALPPYDSALLQREMRLFNEWLVQGLLQLPETVAGALEPAFLLLEQSALEQPRVCVHRDYHSRNLMFLSQVSYPGVIDFQDAVCGPCTYDLVSLLKDCYIRWPAERIVEWALVFYHRQQQAGLVSDAVDKACYLRWFDLMGMQRHLKAAGIFARLSLRDGTDAYLADIPRTVGYLREAAGRYDEFAPLCQVLDEMILPALAVHSATEEPRL